jgi:hypothetical protein
MCFFARTTTTVRIRIVIAARNANKALFMVSTFWTGSLVRRENAKYDMAMNKKALAPITVITVTFILFISNAVPKRDTLSAFIFCIIRVKGLWTSKHHSRYVSKCLKNISSG